MRSSPRRRGVHPALEQDIAHRATIQGLRELLRDFTVVRVVHDEIPMRFANGIALLNHYFIKLGFQDGGSGCGPWSGAP
jgi:hypothetical protein